MNNILITGSNGGIGKALKSELANNGFNCICPTRNELNLLEAKSIEKYFSSLDCEIYALINNAGINILGGIDSFTDENINQMFNVNLVAPLKLIQKCSLSMRKNKCGHIINISSIWGVASKEYRTLYSATKYGLNGITRSLSKELGEYNILVNSVAPGYVNTQLTNKNVSKEEQENIKAKIPLKRFAEPIEIAKLVAFLISKENTYITGQTITIDGGFLK